MLLQLYEQLVPMESERETERMGYQKIPLILGSDLELPPGFGQHILVLFWWSRNRKAEGVLDQRFL